MSDLEQHRREFIELAGRYYEGLRASRFTKSNTAAANLTRLADELRHAHSEGDSPLRQLLRHDDERVRRVAALHALPDWPDEAEPILRSMMGLGSGGAGATAYAHLAKWEFDGRPTRAEWRDESQQIDDLARTEPPSAIAEGAGLVNYRPVSDATIRVLMVDLCRAIDEEVGRCEPRLNVVDTHDAGMMPRSDAPTLAGGDSVRDVLTELVDSVLFHFFAVIDGVRDPSGVTTAWSPMRLVRESPDASSPDYVEMLHDAFVAART